MPDPLALLIAIFGRSQLVHVPIGFLAMGLSSFFVANGSNIGAGKTSHPPSEVGMIMVVTVLFLSSRPTSQGHEQHSRARSPNSSSASIWFLMQRPWVISLLNLHFILVFVTEASLAYLLYGVSCDFIFDNELTDLIEMLQYCPS